MKIYIVEDDLVSRQELVKLLNSYGYTCDFSDNFKDIINLIINSNSDLILLDINLPYFNGHYICKEIRKKLNTPIIVVTSLNNDIEELTSINLGADDFITKPYNPQILLARISSILRRTNSNFNEKISHNGLDLVLSKSIVQYNNNEIELTKNEIKILNVLILNANNIVSRDEIMNELWQSDTFIDDNTLTVNINRLRKKLEQIGAKDYIKTKRGQGYII